MKLSKQEALRRALEFEKKQEEMYGPNLRWWDPLEAAIPYENVRELVYQQYLDVEGGNHKRYRLKDPEAVRKELELGSEVPQTAEVEIPEGLFNDVYGYDDVKKVIVAVLRSRKPVHVLLWGPPATAKTLFLMDLQKLKGASYHLGSSSTKAGLTDFLLEHRPRVLIIDELDKMEYKDYAVLLSVMETGTLSVTKHEKRVEEKMDVWVVGAANRLDLLPPELVSRFQPNVFFFGDPDPEEYKKIVVYMLVNGEGVDEGLARYIAEKAAVLQMDIRGARGLGRVCHTTEEVDEYLEVIRKYDRHKQIS